MDLVKGLDQESIWIIQIFIVVFLSLVLDFFQRRVLNKLQKRLSTTKNHWDDAFVHALKTPISLIIWSVGIALAAQVAGKQTDTEIFTYAVPLRDVAIVAAIAWFFLRFINYAEKNLVSAQKQKDKHIDQTTVDAIAKLLRISVIITAMLVILQTLGFSVSGVLAFGGVGGIAIGFAARDLLANFFGGLMIYLDRPFSVGDWIRSPDRNIEGTVENIGWRLTMIRTFDKRPLYIPNATFANIAVENPSRMSHRRIYETIGVRYDDADKIEAIIIDVEKMLLEHPEIDQSQTLMVNFNKFAASSLDFFVYAFTHTTVWTKYHEIKQDVLMKINNIISQHDAEVAFPTSTVHVPDPVNLSHTNPAGSTA